VLTPRSILLAGAAACSFRRKILFESGLDDPRPAAASLAVSFRYGGEADLAALTAPEFGYSAAARAFGRERLRAGDRFVLCEAEGRVVFYAWVMFRQLDLSCGNYVPLSADRAYTYKLYTVPAYRGLRICPAYYSFLKRELRAMGYGRVLAWVEAGNRASIRAHTRAGFQPVGTIWHFRLLGQSYFVRPRVLGEAAASRAVQETECGY